MEQTVQAAIEKFKCTDNLSTLSEDSIALNSPTFLELLRKMGRIGIIIPHQIKYEDLCNALHFYFIMTTSGDLFDTCKQIDQTLSKDDFYELAAKFCFYSLYEEHDCQYYIEMKSRVKEFLDNNYTPMGIFFSQCCEALENNLFYPCVCGLISLLEGILGRFLASDKISMHVLFESIKTRIADNKTEIVAENILSFIDALTKKADFLNDAEPVYLNRHWLLHGRSNRDIIKLDCISILCAIDAVIDIIQHSAGGT